ncbi:DUF761 domain-containing protein [Cephalotus follicularis]|uniref:DUF761 domain-containing protein n=1 Tax=Cephalotus follicularis TaxID=3775 RepID=A0A1Q3CPB0_CEPFO|nr:DUF761 domain-containing protein [Cephalotus follicularis]
MKNKASGFLKKIISVLTTMAKAKTMALKSKTNALKARLIIFSLLRNKKINVLSSISQRLHALTGQQDKGSNQGYDDIDIDAVVGGDDQSKAIVVSGYYNCNAMSPVTLPSTPTYNYSQLYEDDDDDNEEDKYPDLTHSLFDLADDEDPGGSVIELVKNSKQDQGEEFILEDEIDHVADLFIKRFHRQMRIQKQVSIKNYEDMLNRSA